MHVTALAETPWGLFAGTLKDGVLLRRNGSSAWERVGLSHAVVSTLLYLEAPVPRLLAGMAAFAEETSEAAIYETRNAGASWVAADGGWSAQWGHRGWAHSLAAAGRGEGRLFMGSAYDVLISDDGGSSWRFTWGSPETRGGGSVNALVVSETDDRLVWAAGETAIFTAFVLRSEDRGETWEWIDPLPKQERGVAALVQGGPSQSTLLAGVPGGILRSEDFGRSWSSSLSLSPYSVVTDIGVSVGSATAVVTIDDPHRGETALEVYLLAGGNDWVGLRTPPNAAGGTHVLIRNDEEVIIGTRNGIWRVSSLEQ